MRIENLHAGQTVKNYKALCADLCVNPTTGEAKQKQLEELSKFVKYKKEGQKYIIEEIIGYPDPTIQKVSSTPYVKLIETLLVANLVGEHRTCIEATYKTLFQMLRMASSNYDTIYQNESYEYVYNNIAPISREVYLDFRRSTYSENKKKIKYALESMKNRALIYYKEDMYVCCKDENGQEYHRKPTTAELAEYLKIQQELLAKYKCSNKNELSEKRVKKEYEDELTDAIRTKLNWKYKYTKLTIINGIENSMHALEETKQALVEEARKEKIEINKAELNQAIKKMINRVGEKNHDNAVKKLEEWEKGDEEWGTSTSQIPSSLFSTLYRSKENYLPGWNILTEYYIGGDINAAKDKAKGYVTKESGRDSDVVAI